MYSNNSPVTKNRMPISVVDELFFAKKKRQGTAKKRQEVGPNNDDLVGDEVVSYRGKGPQLKAAIKHTEPEEMALANCSIVPH